MGNNKGMVYFTLQLILGQLERETVRSKNGATVLWRKPAVKSPAPKKLLSLAGVDVQVRASGQGLAITVKERTPARPTEILLHPPQHILRGKTKSG